MMMMMNYDYLWEEERGERREGEHLRGGDAQEGEGGAECDGCVVFEEMDRQMWIYHSRIRRGRGVLHVSCMPTRRRQRGDGGRRVERDRRTRWRKTVVIESSSIGMQEWKKECGGGGETNKQKRRKREDEIQEGERRDEE